jgi:hypothetical protein
MNHKIKLTPPGSSLRLIRLYGVFSVSHPWRVFYYMKYLIIALVFVGCSKELSYEKHRPVIVIQNEFNSNTVINQVRWNGIVIHDTIRPGEVFADSTHELSGKIDLVVTGGFTYMRSSSTGFVVPPFAVDSIFVFDIDNKQSFSINLSK